MKKEMLINTVEGQECRIAILEEGRLEELYIERVSSASRVGNIYKGRITNVEPAIQAAFVDFGMVKNGFLHISDVHPQYFPKSKPSTEAVGRKFRHRDRPPIQECLRRGQEVIVQMTKDGIGTKGPSLTTYISIPGRYLVMMPGMARLGVSRKIEDEEARSKARELLSGLSLPQDMGFIVRTAGMDRGKRDLQRDLNYLLRLWRSVKQRIAESKAPAEIYQESDLVTRTIRDVYNTDIERIICDSKIVALKVKEFLDVALPRTKNAIELYVGKEGLFHDCGLEEEIEKIYARRVEMPSGGSLVIDQAEALVAIDVNSGRFREHSDAETTALKMNQEAAREIARQLRLRDLGGVIIIDFIDMREEKNRRAVERSLRDAIKGDRAKTKVNKISTFGIVEMTRQRVRPSLKHSMYQVCPHCRGSGLIKSGESLSLQVMRSLQRLCVNPNVANIRLKVSPAVAHDLSNLQRRQLGQMESESDKTIVVEASTELLGDQVSIICTNSRGSEVAWEQPSLPPGGKRMLATVGISQIAGNEPEPALTEEEEAAEAAEFSEEIIDVQETAEADTPAQAPAARQPQPPARSGREAAQKPAHIEPIAPQEPSQGTVQAAAPGGPAGEGAEGEAGHPRKRRRGRRGRRRGRSGAGQQPPAGEHGQPGAPSHAEHPAGPGAETRPAPEPAQAAPAPAQAARAPEAHAPHQGQPAPSQDQAAAGEQAQPKKSRRSRRRRRSKVSATSPAVPAESGGNGG
ncbi:MAG: Rne/Rng family ribonuclease [Phycisphaerae bacterium]|jgi:ribonuclease E